MFCATNIISKNTLDQPEIFSMDSSSSGDSGSGSSLEKETSSDSSLEKDHSVTSRITDYDTSDDENASAIAISGGTPQRDSKVRFDSVEVREYPIILGDNPSCRQGPPITIGWEPKSDVFTPVDEFEKLRSEERHSDPDEMFVSSFNRIDILKKLGFSRRDIKKASSKASKLRKKRDETSQHEQKIEPLRQLKDRTVELLSCKKTTRESSPLRSNDVHAYEDVAV
ncbi:unnamed protein product [Cylindrotheca closterium]|uniref:Uncharacterized protein n=1 Tax=Cylindrotheca closterium TaxID=2856 RepID=A0AAD2PUJ8_9STRA|nr:unnamed protein product [Cylindrotheca closterium]